MHGVKDFWITTFIKWEYAGIIANIIRLIPLEQCVLVMIRRQRLMTVLLSLLLMAGGSSALAKDVTVQQALKTAQENTPGKVVAHEKADEKGEPVYRIKILSDKGVMKTLLVSISSGKVIK